jgi:hypothetical protein
MNRTRERVVECLERLQIRGQSESVPELEYGDAFVYARVEERFDLRRASWSLEDARTRYEWDEFPAIRYQPTGVDGTVFVFDRGIFVCADAPRERAADAIEATIDQLVGSFVEPQSVDISVIPLVDGDHGKWDESAFAAGQMDVDRAWCPDCDRVLRGTERYCPSCGIGLRTE